MELMLTISLPDKEVHHNNAAKLGNFSSNLSRNSVAPLQHNLHEKLRSVTCPEMNLFRNAVTVVGSRTYFRFSNEYCETCLFQDFSGHVTLGKSSRQN